MNFREIFRFELAYQLRRPWVWLFVIVLVALDFLMTRDGAVAEVLYSDFFLNSPFGIAKTTVFGSLIWLAMAGAIAGDAAARDVALGVHPLMYTTPIKKMDYVAGRFIAALVLNAFVLLAVQIGILMGVYLPGVDPKLIGPFRPAAFLTAYAFVALPNAFTGTALQFLIASRTGRAMGAYFGSFFLIFMGFFIAAALLFKKSMGTLLDPIGIRFVVEDMAYLWTPTEKNWRLLELKGDMLLNRLLWIGIGVLSISIAYWSFDFKHVELRGFRIPIPAFLKKRSSPQGLEPPREKHLSPVQGQFGVKIQVRKTLAIAWESFRVSAGSPAGLVMLIFLPLLSIPIILDQMVSNSVPLIPTTSRVVAELTGSLSDELSRWVIIPFLIIYLAGELVWRERDARVAEISDAMPGSEWAKFLGKFSGLVLLVILFLTLQIAAGIVAQTIQGYEQYQLGLYVKFMLGLQLTDYLLFTLLALSIHVIVDHKYIAHLVAVIAFVFIALSSLFGIEHNLLVYGASPGWSYSEMRGFGTSLTPWLWFKLYWTSWALLLAVASKVMMMRGRDHSFSIRLRNASARFSTSCKVVAAIAAILITSVGGFIFYNTNILHRYITPSERKELAARYERRFGQYKYQQQPSVINTNLKIDLFPDEGSADLSGSYHLVNKTEHSIDTIHLHSSPLVELVSLQMSRPSVLLVDDKELYHSIYKLASPLLPGDSIELTFRLRYERKGFRENGSEALVLQNGSNFSKAWLPGIGYDAIRELLSPADRRTYQLSERPVIPSVYDSLANRRTEEPSILQTIISTADDQVAIAPGALIQQWTEQGRRYFQYMSDGPIGGAWEFFSARYAIHKTKWMKKASEDTIAIKDVDILIFHHPDHTGHIERIVSSVKACLDYYSREFGPYPFNHLSIVERPTPGAGMHAEPAMITHGEGFTSWNPKNHVDHHDHPYAIVAHEMGHEWPIPAAPVEGAPVMSESMAWYAGIKLVEHAKGPRARDLLLNYMRQPHPYPAIRRGEPLLRALDPYLSYRRGPFALYAISEYIGETKVNAAIRNLRDVHSAASAPLATTLDLYAELKKHTPDSLQYLLHDLFEVNTYWQLKTENASVKQESDGSWEITLEISAGKTVYDTAGRGVNVDLNDWIEVGVFAEGKNQPQTIYLQRHRITSPRHKLVINVRERPVSVGIDPRYLLIDLNRENNVKRIDGPFEILWD